MSEMEAEAVTAPKSPTCARCEVLEADAWAEEQFAEEVYGEREVAKHESRARADRREIRICQTHRGVLPSEPSP